MFSNSHQKSYCIGANNSSVYSKPQYEGPKKQLLPLRPQAEFLARRSQLSTSVCVPSPDKVILSNVYPQQRSVTKNQKQQLAYIEKENRVRQMIPQQQYQAYDRSLHQHSRKMTSGGQSMLMRTPSSGFSSASSSENMFSGLSLNDNDQKLNEMMMDPAAEVDLDIFLLPDARYKPIAQQSASTSRANLSQISHPSQNDGVYTRQIVPSLAKSTIQTPFSDHSYSNIKRSSGYIDYMPTTFASNSIAQQCSSSAALSSSNNVRCNYCWKAYVEVCQRVASCDPVIPCDGPWQWHSLFDVQGRVSCPRLWFAQISRAGNEMIEQLGLSRNAPV